jgi:tetratricopeptide (TPR) repeat protein
MKRLSYCVLIFGLGLELRAGTANEGAVALIQQKKYPEAAEAFQKIAADEPQNAEAHFYLGVLAEKRHDTDEAIQHLEQATQLAPDRSEYFTELGGAYGSAAKRAGLLEKIGWAKKCATALEKAVNLDPDNLTARNGLISFYREAPTFAGGGISKAYEQAEEIRKRNAAMGVAVLGQLYLADKKFDQAFDLYEALLRENPDDYAALFAIGRAAAQTGTHVERGEETLRRCLTLTPPPGQPGYEAVHWRLGILAEKRGNTAEARAEYEETLKIAPSFKQASESLAKLK